MIVSGFIPFSVRNEFASIHGSSLSRTSSCAVLVPSRSIVIVTKIRSNCDVSCAHTRHTTRTALAMTSAVLHVRRQWRCSDDGHAPLHVLRGRERGVCIPQRFPAACAASRAVPTCRTRDFVPGPWRPGNANTQWGHVSTARVCGVRVMTETGAPIPGQELVVVGRSKPCEHHADSTA